MHCGEGVALWRCIFISPAREVGQCSAIALWSFRVTTSYVVPGSSSPSPGKKEGRGKGKGKRKGLECTPSLRVVEVLDNFGLV